MCFALFHFLQVDRLRDKMVEKEVEVETKGKQVTAAQAEKKRAEAELAELRDHMEIKDRKINVLQRKVSTHYISWSSSSGVCGDKYTYSTQSVEYQ